MLRYPNAVVDGDSLENPLNEVYKQDRFLIKPETYRREERFMKKVNLNDDKGWIFPIIETKSAYKQEYVSTEFLSNNMALEGTKGIYQAYLFLTNNETDVRRRFMKIQDLFAVVGGVMKILISVFLTIASGFGLYYRTIELIDLLYDLDDEATNVANQVPSVEISSQSQEQVNNFVQKKAVLKAEKRTSVGIFAFYFRSILRKNPAFKESVKALECAKAYLDERLDLEFLLRHYERFNDLVDLVLSEDQKEQLDAKRKRNISRKFL